MRNKVNDIGVGSNKPKGRVRWMICTLLFIGGIINYLDRANLSIAAPEMMKDLNLSNTDIGLLGSVFSLAYAFSQIPAGMLVDKIKPKKIYPLSVALWSIATAFTGLCNGMSSLLAGRLALGVFESPCMPASAKVTSFWFPGKERGLASGFFDAASKIGPALAVPFLVLLLVTFGWRELFYITGAIGIVFAILFYFGYSNPEENKRLSSEEKEYIIAGGGGSHVPATREKIRLLELFKYRSVWGMIAGYFCTVWLFNIFLVFLPLYLIKTENIVLKDLGLLASIPWAGGVIGDILGGYLSGRLVDIKGMAPMKAKRCVMFFSALIAGGSTVIIPFSGHIYMTITLMTFAIAGIASITGNAWALAADVAPKTHVASVGAIQNFGGYFGGALSPFIVGYIADVTNSFTIAFISGGIIALLSGFAYWFIVKKPIETEKKSSHISVNHERA